MGGGQVKDGEPNKTKHRKWTPEITGTIDRDKYNRNVIDPYDHEPLQGVFATPPPSIGNNNQA